MSKSPTPRRAYSTALAKAVLIKRATSLTLAGTGAVVMACVLLTVVGVFPSASAASQADCSADKPVSVYTDNLAHFAGICVQDAYFQVDQLALVASGGPIAEGRTGIPDIDSLTPPLALPAGTDGNNLQCTARSGALIVIYTDGLSHVLGACDPNGNQVRVNDLQGALVGRNNLVEAQTQLFTVTIQTQADDGSAAVILHPKIVFVNAGASSGYDKAARRQAAAANQPVAGEAGTVPTATLPDSGLPTDVEAVRLAIPALLNAEIRAELMPSAPAPLRLAMMEAPQSILLRGQALQTIYTASQVATHLASLEAALAYTAKDAASPSFIDVTRDITAFQGIQVSGTGATANAVVVEHRLFDDSADWVVDSPAQYHITLSKENGSWLIASESVATYSDGIIK